MKIYKTAPLESWAKMKELRRQYAKEMWTAKQRNELVVLGLSGPIRAWLAGFGRFQVQGGSGPNFGRIQKNPELLARCLQAVEKEGFGIDTCNLIKVSLGAYIIGEFWRDIRSATDSKPDIIADLAYCTPMGKISQAWSRYMGIPHYVIDMPGVGQRGVEYLADNLSEAIEWVERVTGRKCNDELLVEGVQNEWESMVLIARLCELQKAIPAPVTAMFLYSLDALAFRGGRCRNDGVALMRFILDEVRERVVRGLAGLPTERCRLLWEGTSTWFDSGVFRYPERYGATFVGGIPFYAGCAWDWDSPGPLKAAPTLKELGWELKSREDVLRALAHLHCVYSHRPMDRYMMEQRLRDHLRVIQEWKIDHVLLWNDRGCRGNTIGNTLLQFELKKRGISSHTFLGNNMDPRELDMRTYKDDWDSNFELMGLRPLEKEGVEPVGAYGIRPVAG